MKTISKDRVVYLEIDDHGNVLRVYTDNYDHDPRCIEYRRVGIDVFNSRRYYVSRDGVIRDSRDKWRICIPPEIKTPKGRVSKRKMNFLLYDIWGVGYDSSHESYTVKVVNRNPPKRLRVNQIDALFEGLELQLPEWILDNPGMLLNYLKCLND